MNTATTQVTRRPRGTRAPLARLAGLELRKLASVRSGRAVLATMVIVGVLLSLGVCWVLRSQQAAELDVSVVLMAFTVCAALGAPLLGILVFTMDFQSREVLTLFALEPRRRRLFTAKLLASTLLGLGLAAAFILIGLVVSFVFALGFGLQWSPGDLGQVSGMLLVMALVGALGGAALGAALHSTPLSVVVIILQVLLIDNLLLLLPNGIGPYLQTASLSNYLIGEGNPGAALGSFALWLVLPFAIGWWRMMRHEPH